MSAERAPNNPSPLAGEDARERSERPGEGLREPVPPRATATPRPSPAALRAATSPARGEGEVERAGEGPQEPVPLRATATLRAATSPARGEGKRGAATSTVSPLMRRRARALRLNMTDAERKLWYVLRDRRFAGFKFSRQVPVGPFIADFVCFEERLVIEVDGGHHAESLRDQRRDRWFSANEFRVLRFWNNEVLTNLEGVMAVIARALKLEWS